MNSCTLHVGHGAFSSGASGFPSRFAAVALGRNVDPQKHDQENQDRIEHDPDDVGSRMPSLRYNLLVHGGSPQGRKRHAWIAARSTCRREVGKSLGQT
jgi:hypothetical protein